MANHEKTLAELIEETIGEIDELRKSRFSAAEINLGGPGEDGIAGKPANGELEANKSEGEVEKAEDDDEDEDKKAEKAKADAVEKKEHDNKDKDKDKDEDEDKDDMKYMKKSLDDTEELMKSYVDAKICSLEDKLTGIADMVAKIADQPVERAGVPAGVVPLAKSADEVEPLNKSDVATKLFELKKSGNTEVDSADIFRVETGSDYEVQTIAAKYGLK